MSPVRTQAGFTLVELMVAMVVSAIVVLGIYAFSGIQHSNVVVHGRSVRVQRALEGAMHTMARDLRMAGLGFARRCTELRVFDANFGRLVNPGAAGDPSEAVRDPVTGEPYWVLRDGLQAHWNSAGAVDLPGSRGRSSTPDSAADSFDVILAQSGRLGSSGVFVVAEPLSDTLPEVVVQASTRLDNLDPAHLVQIQQLFVPGSFILVVEERPGQVTALRPEGQGPCALLQVTGDVRPEPGARHRWRIPIDGSISGFDADVSRLMDFGDGGQRSVIALGRVRWSRYEIDYTVATQPYLVRHDIIGYREGSDPDGLGSGPDYPECAAGQCVAPQLHLPGGGEPAPAIAVGPMIEDLQVAVGCDGYSREGALAVGLPPPDLGFEEAEPNTRIDERLPGQGRERDEWLGNARHEQWAPDCVFYGTAQRHAAEWAAVFGSQQPPPAFRMSPQAIRVTLVGALPTEEAAGGLADARVLAIEDRPPMSSVIGRRERFTVTEHFVPKNLRWRDPSIR
ncbi:MAG: prepilin-type N-terminal cleavage/methylation domain-containing protein [Myxococcota bacterium]